MLCADVVGEGWDFTSNELIGKNDGVEIFTPKYSCALLLSYEIYFALFATVHGGLLPLPCISPPLRWISIDIDPWLTTVNILKNGMKPAIGSAI